MRKINYKKLAIQNFLSIGNDAVVIEFQKGLNLITGRNNDNPERVNGVGKSVINDAFYYSLFGKTIREINKEFVVNNITKGKGNIELEFDVEDGKSIQSYKIVRQVKPSKVELWKGDEDITRDSIANTNSFIENLLGTNSALCRSCDILSLSDNIPFMAKNAGEKRKFIEDIFSLEVFSRMIKDLKADIKENKSDLSVSQAKIDEIGNTIVTLNKQKESFLKELEEREGKLLEKKRNTEEDIKRLEDRVDSFDLGDDKPLKKEKEKYEAVAEKILSAISKQEKKITEQKTLLKMKRQEIAKAESVGGAKCDKCLQDIGEDHKEHVKEMIDSLTKDVNEIEAQISTFTEKLDEINDKRRKVNKKISELTTSINEIALKSSQYKSLVDNLTFLRKDLRSIEEDLEKSKESTSFEDNIDETVNRLDEEKKNKAKLELLAEDLKVCAFILGEEGVKSFVIKKLLGLLNNSIQQYIIDLGMNIRCTFDEYFEEKMINDKGKAVCYHNLSGGERRTIDLACAWAFKDLKSKISGIKSNLEMMDEIFDSAFDSVGFDKLVEVIKSRIDKNKTCVYTISHRQETYKHIDAEIVMLEKENGITKRVDNYDPND